MNLEYTITEPFQFNPLKHHLSYIKEFISGKLSEEEGINIKTLVKEVRHIGTSVMDIYTGNLSVLELCSEITDYLQKNRLDRIGSFSEWTGKGFGDFKTIAISDRSVWTLKYHSDEKRFVHLFPARLSPHSFRVKANTLKSALLYYIIIGKDFISRADLNNARQYLGLSPVKDTAEAEAITEMIEILREPN
jgi:hypothetical protein